MVISLFSLLKQHGEQSGMTKSGFILLAYMCSVSIANKPVQKVWLENK